MKFYILRPTNNEQRVVGLFKDAILCDVLKNKLYYLKLHKLLYNSSQLENL